MLTAKLKFGEVTEISYTLCPHPCIAPLLINIPYQSGLFL